MLIEIMSFITIIFIALCLISIAVSYFWAKRQNAIYPKTMENVQDYTFFFQSIVDSDGKTSGVEALLRKFDTKTGKWIFPDDIDKFTLREVIFLLHKSFIKTKHPSSFLAINISLKQFADPRYEYFIRWVKGECYPMELRIEFNMQGHSEVNWLKKIRIKKNLKLSKELNVAVILEKIQPSKAYYKKVKWLLNDIHGVKVPLSNFHKKTDNEWLEMNMGDWSRLIRKKNKKIDITEVENEDDLLLADKLEIDNRQGYLIDRPHSE